jgi:cephalosporin hydroxylase
MCEVTPPKVLANEPDNILAMSADAELGRLVRRLYPLLGKYKYPLNFSWLGRPVVQLPTDLVALQELVWSVRPDLVIETGVAHGGSLIFYASLLELMGGTGRVVGVDIEIRPHNRQAIEQHPLSRRIDLIEGSSTDQAVVSKVRELAMDRPNVMVVLDSDHTHRHVLKELELYSSLVGKGGYLVVLDTVVEDMPAESFPDRPWGPGNSPKTAVWEFLRQNSRFKQDRDFEAKLLITTAPDGFLKCVEDIG